MSSAQVQVRRLLAIKMFAANAALGFGQLELADKLAVELIDELIEADVKSSTPYAIRADVAIRKDDPQAAMDSLSAGLERIPDAADLLWILASVRISEEEFEAADALINRLKAIDGSDPLVNFLNARIALEKRQWESAKQTLEDVRPDVQQWPEIARYADLLFGTLLWPVAHGR